MILIRWKSKKEQQGKKQVKDEKKEFAVSNESRNFYNIINKDGKTTVYMDVKQ